MTNKKESKPTVNQVNNKNVEPNKVADKKQKTPIRKSSVIDPASIGRSAVDAVKVNSSKNVRGSSGLANTGTIISYD